MITNHNLIGTRLGNWPVNYLKPSGDLLKHGGNIAVTLGDGGHDG
jgi:hypothetical protein